MRVGQGPESPSAPIMISRPCYTVLRHQLFWGTLRQEPATSHLDWSFAPMPEFDDRFARQNRDRLPPEVTPASPCSGIARWLSGCRLHTRPRVGAGKPAPLRAGWCGCRTSGPQGPRAKSASPMGWFPFGSRVEPLHLACSPRSLVRVSRRAPTPRITGMGAGRLRALTILSLGPSPTPGQVTPPREGTGRTHRCAA